MENKEKLLRNILTNYWNENPLLFVVITGAIIRLLAVFFSKGYGMHDDHFLVIEAAQSWVDDFDYNNWLPKNRPDNIPTGHSFFYVGLHYLLFSVFQFLKIHDPQFKMLIVRLLHALYSLSIIYYGYKIAYKVAGQTVARNVGIFLALLWFFPNMSVRNLVEFVCIPPLLCSTWILFKNENKVSYIPFLIAGIIAGVAVSIRFQSIIFVGGLTLVVFINRKFIGTFLFLSGVFIAVFLTQATDLFTWGRPFAEFAEYIRYNINHAYQYLTQKWYMYLLFISGMLIPPISLYLIFGFIRNWKKNLILFLPATIFLVFHSAFPNKQERFILPVIPFIIILGLIGWQQFLDTSNFLRKKRKILKSTWVFFWIINSILLVPVSIAYSKKSRVESMIYLSKQDDFRNFIIESSHKSDYTLLPLFYLNKWVSYAYVTGNNPLSNIVKYYDSYNKPNYIIFWEDIDLENRMQEFRNSFPSIQFEAMILPSFIDRFMHLLNPGHLKMEIIYIYKIPE